MPVRPNVETLIASQGRKERKAFERQRHHIERLCDLVPAEHPIEQIATFSGMSGDFAAWIGVAGITPDHLVIVAGRGDRVIPIKELDLSVRASNGHVHVDLRASGRESLVLFGERKVGEDFVERLQNLVNEAAWNR